MNAQQRYEENLTFWTDVQAHLPMLFDYARGNVVELGVRAGISTSALLAGVEVHGGHVYSIDRDPNCAGVFDGHLQWTFLCSDSLDERVLAYLPDEITTLFIDTGHTYEQTLAELKLYGSRMSGTGRILLHDTDDGSTFPGVRQAIYEYCGLSRFFWLYPGSYGLGVIA